MRAYGENHPDTLTVLFSLANLNHAQGRLERAETLARDVLDRTPADHPQREMRQSLLEAILGELDRSGSTDD